MTPRIKKNYLRLAIATVYLIGMMLIYGSDQKVVWWFWMWPLFIAFVMYSVIIWSGRCPTCKADFALESGERGFAMTTMTCRFCGAQCQRLNGGAGGGGGP
ncbi:hypothetical protein C8D92_101246 [Tamilnaduibacter salinus]|uniref:Uncharacterized protein n=1 Tax=Tamilnaduibacter salinus TaxID=1484056 RepID=A0A2A2I540_9GAMM|nr:hypothetical protein [Tamilnaduibacter salinus]PAV27131.1 hypothetical protein CF392_01360 [Tamilnaduibacter salinus]PVY79040.1 hypothetical protein C8D92_101246 [Tamilnaduibacter salinus]